MIRKKYRILKEGIDFYEIKENANGGTRAKKNGARTQNWAKSCF